MVVACRRLEGMELGEICRKRETYVTGSFEAAVRFGVISEFALQR